MNIATRITLFRIFLVPFFMLFMFMDNIWTRIFALVIFIIGGITDMLDGIIARKHQIVTSFGIFLDPLADKLIISAALISFVGLIELSIPAWMIVLIISREFMITGLRLLALSQGKIITADKTGKFKTTTQIIAIIIILLILIVNSALKHFYSINHYELVNQAGTKIWGMILVYSPFWIMFYVTFLTLYSGISYIYKHKDVFYSANL